MGARLHHPVGARLRRSGLIAPSGPDQGAIALSLLACFIKLQGGILSKISGEVGSGAGSVRILGGCGAVGGIA